MRGARDREKSVRCALKDDKDLRILSKAISCGQKVGDELSICAHKERLVLRTRNQGHTMYCEFSFSANFFSEYSFRSPSDGDQLQEVFATKHILPVLKAPA